jgi:hypothetical protein
VASGDTLFTFAALAGLPPSTAFAVLTRRNNHPVYQFDATTSWMLDFEAFLSRRYSGGGITLSLAWMAATAVSGAVVWSAQWERHDTATDLDSDSFATAVNSSAITVPGTSGFPVYTPIAFTNGAQLDSLAVGEHFRLRVLRLPADSGDTAAGFAQLLGVEGRET